MQKKQECKEGVILTYFSFLSSDFSSEQHHLTEEGEKNSVSSLYQSSIQNQQYLSIIPPTRRMWHKAFFKVGPGAGTRPAPFKISCRLRLKKSFYKELK